MRHALAIGLLVTALASPAGAQVSPGFAGNWTLTENDAAGRGGRGGGIPGVPLATQLTIRVSPAEVTIDTNTGSERFTPRAGGRLEWSVTLDDPTTWTKPWTFAMPLTADPDERIMEYACHEGNRAMANILSAARVDERAVEEAAKKGIERTLSDAPTVAEGEN